MSGTTTCPTCGRDDFDHQRAMRMHHYAAHGESIANVVEKCDECGGEFEILKERVEDGRGKYCSVECMNASMEKKHEVECGWCGKTHVRQENRIRERMFCGNECRAEYQKDKYRVKRECDNCGSEFEIVESMLKYRMGNYCSRECLSDDRTYECVCDNCGREFIRKKSNYEGRDNHYCSMDCLHEHNKGENHPSWSGGEQYYGPDWSNIREKIIERDGEECRSCGDTDELHVHHIEPLSSFDGYENANTEDNLITLCAGCHAEVEWGEKECTEP